MVRTMAMMSMVMMSMILTSLATGVRYLKGEYM